jgi:EAL domain-containing protein (putative c-di-GMP-specific phosphodiesterase class I)
MNLQASRPSPAGTPWLEHTPQPGGPAQKTLLVSFPFSIGRNDATDLPITSTRVSREHAAIVRAVDTYRVRDLDSTNGTFVNGQRIEEATLTDGDILLIADVEFTFFSGNLQAPRKTVTQVIGFREADSTNLQATDLVRTLRRLQETVLQGSQRVEYQSVFDLVRGQPMGYEAHPGWAHGPLASETDRLLLTKHPRLSTRLRESFWLLAAESVLERPALKLFLPLEARDMEHDVIEGLLERLSTILPDFSPLVLELPDSAVNDLPYFHELYSHVRSRGAGLCYRDFAAGKARLDELAKSPPDFLRLGRSLMRGVWNDAHRRAHCFEVVQACREMECEAIAIDVESEEQTELLRTMGCRFGTGKALCGHHEAPERKPEIGPDTPARGIRKPVLV